MLAERIILDCDPGQDDAVAILLALASPDEIDLIAITTVAGNVSLDLTAKNARRICELAGRPDLPVYAGCPRPMVRDLTTAEHIHGRTGLDGCTLPDPEMPLAQGHAVDFLVETIRGEPEKSLTLAVTGPMTNVAQALVQAPDIARCLKRVVLMGGAWQDGNVTPVAEFNVHADPDAASVVFESGAEIVMFGLNVTHKVITTPERLAAIRAVGGDIGREIGAMLGFYDRNDPDRYAGLAGAPLHDPCTIAWLIRPDLFSGRRCHVAVECASDLTLGQTVVDWWGRTGNMPNALVMDGADADGFYDLVTGRLARLQEALISA
jgi:purine nucleosidase